MLKSMVVSVFVSHVGRACILRPMVAMFCAFVICSIINLDSSTMPLRCSARLATKSKVC